MRPLSYRLSLLLWAAIGLGLAAHPVSACAVCFGDPNSELVQGAKAGVFVLMAIVYAVIFGMVGVAGVWFVRARKLAAAESQEIPGEEPDDASAPCGGAGLSSRAVSGHATLSTDINANNSTK